MWSPKPYLKNSQRDPDESWIVFSSGYEPGIPGIEIIIETKMKRPVNTLLWRDEDGFVVGIFHYYPEGLPLGFKTPEEVDIMVRPDYRKQGLGMILIKEAINLWDIQAKKQRYNEASAALTESWLKENRRKKYGTTRQENLYSEGNEII